MNLFRRLLGGFGLYYSVAALASPPPTLSFSVSGGQIILAWPQNAPGFQLESVPTLDGSAVWQPTSGLAVLSNGFHAVTLPAPLFTAFYRLSPAPLTSILNTSPADGEVGVSVLRETIIRFTAPLATNTLITPDQFYAETSAGPLLTRIELSSDLLTASLFYLEPIPSGAQATVTFDGTGIYDQDGRPLDAEGDGQPGGMKVITFETFNTTPLPNTAVIGQVLASVPLAGGNGIGTTNHPLANVTITVDGQEETLRTTTDAQGMFSLNPCPAGRFFVKIDGRTATGSIYPTKAYYPFVGKAWQAVAGLTNNLAGGTGLIYLPLIAQGTLQPTSLTTNTTITFPPSVLAANPGLAGVSVTIPANSLYSDDGTRGGQAGLAPVSPSQLPAPLPPGVHPPLVITIQTDGADNLDSPAPVQFPNLPDLVTGTLLPPGAKTAIWGFNHKSGRWEIQGLATVSADGKFVASDAGYGVRQPGWEFPSSGTAGLGGGGGPGTKPGAGPAAPNPNDPCQTERKSLESSTIQCGVGVGLAIITTIGKAIPGVGCGISAIQGVIGSVADCNIDPSSCGVTIAQNVLNTAIGCVPVLGAGLGSVSTGVGLVKSCGLDEALALGAYNNCKTANGLNSLRRPQLGSIPNNIWNEQLALLQGIADVETTFFGDVVWTEVEIPEDAVLIAFFTQLEAAMQPGSDGGVRITAAEQTALLALPLPSNITHAAAAALVSRMDQIAAGTLPAGALDFATLSQQAQTWLSTLNTLAGRGWVTTYDAFTLGLTQPFAAEDQAQSGQSQTTKPLAYRLVDLSANGLAQYGTLNLIGQFENLLLTPNDFYEVDYADLDSFYIGHTVFQAGGPGLETIIPRAAMSPGDPLDSDGNGLPDDIEVILGRNPLMPDPPGEGLPGGADIPAGTNPPAAGPPPFGLIGSAASTAELLQIAVSGPVALVAQANGVAVYDVSADQPLLVGVLALNGPVNAVAFSGNLGLATIDNSGVAVIDLSNPASPRVASFVGLPQDGTSFLRIAAAGNRAYALSAKTLYLLDISQGLLLDQRAINSAVEDAQPQDIAVSGAYIYLLTGHVRSYPGDVPGQHHLHKILVDQVIGFDAETLDMAGSNFVADVPTRIAALPGFVYLTGLNGSTNPSSSGLAIISDDTNGLRMIAPPRPLGAVCLAADGSGGVIVGATNLFVTDVRNPLTGAVLVTNFALPSPPKSVAIGSGLAYVADDYKGLLALNYPSPGTNGQPPSVSLLASFSLNPPVAPPGRTVVVSAAVTNDFQVRSVEFYLNGVLNGVAGSSPFDFWFTTPATNNSQFTIQARAIDNAENVTLSQIITVNVLESATPPAVTGAFPLPNSDNLLGTASVQAFFDRPLDPGSVNAASLQVVSAGADGILGTPDDVAVPGDVTYAGNPPALSFAPSAAFSAGLFGATVGTGVADTNGNRLASSYAWSFTLKQPVLWNVSGSGSWLSAGNWTMSNMPQTGDFVEIPETNAQALITFSGGSVSLDSLVSEESLEIQNGTFSLARQSSVDGDLTFAGTTLEVTDELDISGTFNWESGLLDGGGVIAANAMDLSGGSLSIGTITLINRGNAVWHPPLNSSIIIEIPAIMTENAPVTMIENAPGAVFQSQGAARAYWSGLNPPRPQFSNQGLFQVLSGSNNATIFAGVDFNNSGVVQIESGTLELEGAGGESGGEFDIAAGAVLQFDADNQTTPSSLISGAGTMRVSGGNVVINGTYNVTGETLVDGGAAVINGDVVSTGPILINGSFGGNGLLTFSPTTLNLNAPIAVNGGALYLNNFAGTNTATRLSVTNGGALIGTSDLTVSGPLILSNGVAYGPGKLIALGNSTIGGFALSESGNAKAPRPIDNAGYLSVVGDIQAGSALIRNLAGATLDCVGDHLITSGLGSSATPLINLGTLVKSSGTNMFVIEPPLHNSGLILANSGEIVADGGYLQTGGELRLSGGGVGGYPSFEMEAGLITGSGRVDIYQFNNTGAVVSPGLTNAPVGSFQFTSEYNQGPAGTLAIDILNSSASGFDHLTATGPATIAGTLALTAGPGYVPAVGDSFRILQSSALTGQFAKVVGADLGSGLKFAVNYDSTGVTLMVVGGF